LEGNKGKHFKSAVAIKPGKIDRSPTGTALSAKMAILHKHGKIGIGDKLTAISIIDSEFTGQILGITKVGNMDAILPEISGRAWITGTHQYMLDPSDPWPGGYRISDTWGV
jgi:proline racemase